MSRSVTRECEAYPLLLASEHRITVSTANTMSSAIEALGMAVPGSSSRPALYPSKEVVDASVAGKEDLRLCMGT